MRSGLIAAFLTFALSGVAEASDDYLCTVKTVRELSDTGELTDSVYAHLVGKRFTVDRETGEMTGDVEHPIVARYIVVDRGSSEQGFKVAAVSGAEFGFLHSLHVHEYIEATEKPFVHSNGSRVLTGTCVHL